MNQYKQGATAQRSSWARLIAGAIALVIVLAVTFLMSGLIDENAGQSVQSTSSATASSQTSLASQATRSSDRPSTRPTAPDNPSSLPVVAASELPAEARQTLSLIARGGPYPYDRDGINFGNFEGLLPKKRSGYYREYTVDTPGVSSRGARRIVVGAGGEKYYTGDHYASFRFIQEDR